MTENERTERLLAETAWLRQLARSLVADRDIAADVAQQTLLVAWQRRLRGVADLRSWLATVARNLARRMARSESRRRRHEAALPPPGAVPDPAEVVAKTGMLRDVVDAALRLEEPYRATLLLRYQEDLGYAQIAARMRVPVETVRTRIKRALQQLRSTLDARHGGSRAWAVPLLGVTGFEQALAAAAPPAATGAAGGTALAGAGVLVMSAQAKLVAAALVLVTAVLAWQFWPGAAPPLAKDGDRSAGAEIAASAAPAPAEPESPAPPATRVPVPKDATAAGSKPPPADGRTGPWLLTGRVLDDATGLPVQGAAVSVSSPMAPPTETWTTDAEGRFAVPLRNTYSFELAAEHEGHAAAFAPLNEILAAIRQQGGAADAPSSYAIGDLRLLRGQRVSGRVLAADGTTPVAGAKVLHYRAVAGLAMRPFATARVAATSGPDGSFTLAGRYAPDHRLQYLFADTEQGLGWSLLQVSRREGDASPQRIVLRPTAAVEVEVAGADDAAVALAQVTAIPQFQPLGLAPPGHSPPLASDPNPAFHARADADGRARLLLLPIGDDGAQFGRAVAGGSYVLHVFADGSRTAYVPLVLQAGTTTRQRVVLAAAGASLRVHGAVVDAAGRPVGAATVELGGNIGAPAHTLTAGADGYFACADASASASPLLVVARAPGFVTERREVTLAGEPELELRLQLARALPIRGRVVDQDGRPVANAPVYLGEQFGLDNGKLADQDGAFAFDDAPPGLHVLQVLGRPEEQVFAPVRLEVDNRTEPQRVEVRMHRVAGVLASFELTVCERAGGQPLEPILAGLVPVDERGAPAGTIVPLSPFVGGARARNVPPGRYLLKVETQQGHRGSKPVEIAAGIANVRDRLELDAPGGVTVTVDLSAVPALSRPRQLQVELQPWDAGRFGARNKKDVGDRRLAWFCLDLDAGTDFDLEGVQPGVPCKLSVRDERLTGELEFTVGPAQQTSATLRVRPQ